MKAEPLHGQESRLHEAASELRDLILRRYPSATFEVAREDDPEGLYLTPVVDVEDVEEVFDLVVDRLLELQIDQGLPLYVVPIRPLERVLATARPARGVTPER